MKTLATSDVRSAAATQAKVQRPRPAEPRGLGEHVRAPSIGDSASRRVPLRLRDAWQAAVSPLRGFPAWVLLVVLFVGSGWLRAAVEKLVDPLWWNGTTIRAFVEDHVSLTLPWYRGVLDTFVLPNVVLVAIVVVVAQLFVGASLLSGRKAALGLIVGMFLNLNFVAAGAVNPSIFYLVCQAALLLWMLQYRPQVGFTGRMLRWLTAASLALLVLNLPFIASLDPAAVIDDPALVLAFFGVLLALSSRLGVDRSPSEAEAAPARVPFSGPTASHHVAPLRSSRRSCVAVTWAGPAGYVCATERW